MQNGKPFPRITTIAQDGSGYLWMATPDGLGRYNGQELKLEKELSEKIQANRIRHLLNYNDSTMLIFGQNRIAGKVIIDVLNTRSLEIEPLDSSLKEKTNSIDFSHFSMTPEDILLNSDQSIGFKTHHQLYEYKEAVIKEILDLPDSLYLHQHIKTRTGNSWVLINEGATGTLLWYIDSNGKVIEETTLTPMLRNTHSGQLFYVDAEEQLYFSNTYLLNGKEETVCYKKKIGAAPERIKFSTGENYRYQRYVAPYQQIWCSNNDEFIYCFDLEGNFICKTDPIENFGGVALKIGFFDNQNGFWWLMDNIPHRVQLEESRFRVYFQSEREKLNLGPNIPKEFSLRGIVENTRGDLLICGNFGAIHFDKEGRIIHSLNASIQEQISLQMKNARLAAYAERDIIWMTDERMRLIKYNTNNLQYETFTYSALDDVETKLHWSILRDKHQRLWLGHLKGLSYLDEESGQLRLFDQYNGFDELKESSVFHMHANKEGIWLATTSGLYLLDPKKGIQKRFYKDAKNTLPHNTIAHFYEDKNGWFWLATKGAGLVHWNHKTGAQQQFTTKEGLANNTIYAVYEDDYGKLWMSSNDGIMSMDKNTYNINHYTKYDGLPHKEFNTVSHYKNKEGRIFFGSLNGGLSFHPKDFRTPEENNSALFFSSFLVYNQLKGVFENKTASFNNENKIILTPDASLAEVHFSFLDFREPSHNEYEYKIDGFHENWQRVFPARFSIGGIRVGTYTVLIRAKGPKGNWSKPTAIPLVILPPFYMRTDFLISMLLGLILLVWLLVRWRTHRLRNRQIELEKVVVERTAQLEEQAEELKELDHLKSRFFANISHELRTPLTLIMGPLSYIIDQPEAITKETLLQLKTMDRNGKRLLQLIEEILDLAKMEAGKLELNESPVPLNLLLQDIYRNFSAQAQVKGINFQLDSQVAPDLQVLLDQEKVEKIITNLLSNAFKFTHTGGKVNLKTHLSPSKIILAVTDTGKGIHPKDLQHVFNRFYQASVSSQVIEGGTGIGLALCKEYVQLMTGTIEVKSDLGQGSTFTVELPLKPVAANKRLLILDREDEAFDPISIQTETISSGKKVLLVEDNEDMREFVAKLLSTIYQVDSCANGVEALEILAKTEPLPVLIVSDIMMPEMDGFELLKRLKTHEEYQKIPVVMLTARAAQKDKLKALRIGVDDYLTKPFSAQELLVRVSNLDRNAILRQQFNSEEEAMKLEEGMDSDSANQKEDSQFPERDKIWLEEIEEIVRKKAIDIDFNPDKFAEQVGLSRSSLYRKMKKLTGLTPSQYLKEIRLQIGREVLERGTYHNITEVCYEVGFGTPYYFTKEFEKRFGRKVTSYFK